MSSEPPVHEPSPAAAGRRLLDRLIAEFAVFRDGQPLAIGIDKQLLARLPDLDRKLLRVALGMHTRSLRYLKMTARATLRYDLDGKPEGEVLPEHRSRAAQLVEARLQQQAAQRKAQREAEALAQRRTLKLHQLVEKFGRNR